MIKSKPCPKCGGEDRFFYLSSLRILKGAPGWMCRQCRYVDKMDLSTAPKITGPELTDEQLKQVHDANEKITRYCEGVLWSDVGTKALDYLRTKRGFTDDTIRDARLGYHPSTKRGAGGVGQYLWHHDRLAYKAARLSGLLREQGQEALILQGTITIPYLAAGKVTMIRGRMLDPKGKTKYLSPFGALYAGGTPTLFGQDVLVELAEYGRKQVILTEGEFKAQLATQCWKADMLSMPAVAQPGISIFPVEFIQALSGFTVYLTYDVEARKNPFTLSPGEQFTIRNGKKLLGLDLKGKIKHYEKKEKEEGLTEDQQKGLLMLKAQYQEVVDLKIKVKVVRLTRYSHESKVDLDGYLLNYGSLTLEALLHNKDRVLDFKDWIRDHGGNGCRFYAGAIYQGQKRLSNYQAIIIEDIMKKNGLYESIHHRLALRTPSGIYREADISTKIWAKGANDAMSAIRAQLLEGSAKDENHATFSAIKDLSRKGDDPMQRVVFTAPGWQKLLSGWHFLAIDGAINAQGMTTAVTAELNPNMAGMHYQLCVDGDPKIGAQIVRKLLSGEVCPKPVAYIHMAHIALAPIHFQIGSKARAVLWNYGQSGNKKSALSRVFLAFYGPKFTAIRGDGAAVAKWAGTTPGLEKTCFTNRDCLFMIDDYKGATTKPKVLATILHNYSESTGRQVAKRNREADDIYPARGLMISTGESLPVGDVGQSARILPWEFRKGEVNEDGLAEAQSAGVNGHLVALFREYLQEIAASLDRDELKSQLRQIISSDTDQPESAHDRTAEGLRQNRVGWLMFSAFLERRRYIPSDERERIDKEYHSARHAYAAQHATTLVEERPADKLLSILSEMIQTGEVVLEGQYWGDEDLPNACPACGNDDYYVIQECKEVGGSPAWFCRMCERSSGNRFVVTTPEVAAREKAQRERQEIIREGKRQVIGFYHAPKRGKHKNERAVALYPETAFTVVQKSLGLRGERFQYRAGDIWAQMADEGYLVRMAKGKWSNQKRSPYKVRVTAPGGGRPPVLLVQPDLLLVVHSGTERYSDCTTNEDQDTPGYTRLDSTYNTNTDQSITTGTFGTVKNENKSADPNPNDQKGQFKRSTDTIYIPSESVPNVPVENNDVINHYQDGANEYNEAYNGDDKWYSDCANEYQQDAHTVPDEVTVPSVGASDAQNTLPAYPAWEPKTMVDFLKVIEHCLMVYGVMCSYDDYFEYSTRQGYMKLTEAKYREYRSILA